MTIQRHIRGHQTRSALQRETLQELHTLAATVIQRSFRRRRGSFRGRGGAESGGGVGSGRGGAGMESGSGGAGARVASGVERPGVGSGRVDEAVTSPPASQTPPVTAATPPAPATPAVAPATPPALATSPSQPRSSPQSLQSSAQAGPSASPTVASSNAIYAATAVGGDGTRVQAGEVAGKQGDSLTATKDAGSVRQDAAKRADQSAVPAARGAVAGNALTGRQGSVPANRGGGAATGYAAAAGRAANGIGSAGGSGSGGGTHGGSGSRGGTNGGSGAGPKQPSNATKAFDNTPPALHETGLANATRPAAQPSAFSSPPATAAAAVMGSPSGVLDTPSSVTSITSVASRSWDAPASQRSSPGMGGASGSGGRGVGVGVGARMAGVGRDAVPSRVAAGAGGSPDWAHMTTSTPTAAAAAPAVESDSLQSFHDAPGTLPSPDAAISPVEAARAEHRRSTELRRASQERSREAVAAARSLSRLETAKREGLALGRSEDSPLTAASLSAHPLLERVPFDLGLLGGAGVEVLWWDGSVLAKKAGHTLESHPPASPMSGWGGTEFG